MSLEKKIELIKASAAVPKPSQKDLGEKFEIGRSTVSDILKKKDHYLKAWESTISSAKRQRIEKTTPMESLNDLLFSFFCTARPKNLPISGPILQSKAIAFAGDLGISFF
jgi:hypothetical protein